MERVYYIKWNKALNYKDFFEIIGINQSGRILEHAIKMVKSIN